jgi:hypothetical protein
MDLAELAEKVAHLTELVNALRRQEMGTITSQSNATKKRTSGDTPITELLKGFMGKKNTHPRQCPTTCSVCDGSLGEHASMECCDKSIRLCATCTTTVITSIQELSKKSRKRVSDLFCYSCHQTLLTVTNGGNIPPPRLRLLVPFAQTTLDTTKSFAACSNSRKEQIGKLYEFLSNQL